MSDCIEWTGAINSGGYGNLWYEGKYWKAHRLAWAQANGPIPPGMFVLHRCDNPPCVNLEHLFLGTAADNTADMLAKGRSRGQRVTHCPHGHEYTPGNTYLSAEGTGHRHCRTCVQARRARKRLASPS